MTCQCTVYKLLLIVLVSVLIPGLLAQQKKWRLDCTKYVYAPRCRGVSAKRAYDPTTHSDSALPQLSMEDLVLRSFLNSLRDARGNEQARQQSRRFQNSELIQQDFLQQPVAQDQNSQEQEDNDSFLLPALLLGRSAHQGQGHL